MGNLAQNLVSIWVYFRLTPYIFSICVAVRRYMVFTLHVVFALGCNYTMPALWVIDNPGMCRRRMQARSIAMSAVVYARVKADGRL
jgi:hypothetical protein